MKRASCGLLYGALNTLKTSNLGRIARYLYETFGFDSRMVTADNEYDTVKDLVEAGVIDVFSIKGISNPFGILTKLSQGYWPAVRNGKIVMCPTPPERLAKIGAYLIEGTTTIGEACHADHINKARKIGEGIVGEFADSVETDTGTERITYGKSAQSHYQQVQDYVCYNLIPGFGNLPVKWVWWSGHEYMGEDEATGQARIGPGVVGKAAVMKVPRVIGNTFHLVAEEEVATNPQSHKTTRQMVRRAYFEKHKDKYLATQYWPAGLKMPVGEGEEDFLKQWNDRFPDGYIELTRTQGVEEYVRFHQEIARKSQKLVIVPGTEEYVDTKEKEIAAAPAVLTMPSTGSATQTRPPARPAYPPRPSRFPARPLVGGAAGTSSDAGMRPTLEDQLKQSVEKVTGQPVTEADINAVPISDAKEPT